MPTESKPSEQSIERVRFSPIEGSQELLTTPFLQFLLALHDQFTPRVHGFRRTRAEVLARALHEGGQPGHPERTEVNTQPWNVPGVPEALRQPGIEISGPASVTGMFINGLNPGPEGTRADGDLDDDEDSAGHRFEDTLRAALNRRMAVERRLEYYDEEKKKQYRIQPGDLPFFMHRERGLHLDEPELTIDGNPVPASILGTALTLFHAGRAQTERGQGIYFYLPKLESAEEAGFWKDFFSASRQHLASLKDAEIRAIPLVESLPAAYQMEEMLYALGPYAGGLNAARWDFQASILEYVMADPAAVWPDRFGVDIKTTDFLANIFRRLVAICLKHRAVPIGGMATALPSRDADVNRVAADAIRADKQWEARQGFVRGWVAHTFHMKTAADPFKELCATGWRPGPEMADPDRFPLEILVPSGPVTFEGTRRNARMLLEYVEGWLNGRGAKGIDTLDGSPGVHPALMEDLATARISVAQTSQRILHGAQDQATGTRHDYAQVKRIMKGELHSILGNLSQSDEAAGSAGAEERYRKAFRISLQWIRNYTELNFRSLGSYTRADLDRIAGAPDAF